LHIPDGFLDPKTWVSLDLVSAGGLTYAFYKVKEEVSEERVPLLGVLAAFIFAAQMLNFPVIGGTSGHLIGGLLAAVLLGPWAGSIVITSVLIIQALIFQDGGITALGANIFNMAIIGSIGAYYIYHLLLKVFGEKGFLVSVALAAWSSVFLASLTCALELAFSGTIPLNVVLPAMGGIHALIGMGEALITVAVVSLVKVTRPDLITTLRGEIG
jgi:cobalt/nickel transport system permease protein